MRRIAVISVHGCPVIQAGGKDAGGMNIYVLETARALSTRGVQVDIFTRHHDALDPMVVHLSPGARAIHLPAGAPSTDKHGVFELLPEFTRQVESFASEAEIEYDLVASHYWLSGLVGMELAKAWDVPHVTSFHTLAEVKRRARPEEREHAERHDSELQIARAVDKVIVWTDHERELISELYGACCDRITVIPPGVDSRKFTPMPQREARAALGMPEGKVLLYVGRLERLEGLDILFKAVSQLECSEEVTLYIAGGSGNPQEVAWLMCMASELGISDRVKIIGSVPQEKLKLYYNAADVCVLPSYYESFGLAALEAAACGRPVVASKVGGLTTVVKDGETGYLVSWQCPGPFVERLDLLLNSDELRERMGVAARRHAETLRWSDSADRLIEAYRGLITTHSAEPALAGD